MRKEAGLQLPVFHQRALLRTRLNCVRTRRGVRRPEIGVMDDDVLEELRGGEAGEIYAFFKHEEQPESPRYARALLESVSGTSNAAA